jgi:hypothetical protein
MPLYRVEIGEGEAKKERLVEAGDSRNARSFVAAQLLKVERASQADCFRLAKAGVEIEAAVTEPELPEIAPEPKKPDAKPDPKAPPPPPSSDN